MSQLAAHFRDIVSGRRRGTSASCQRALLRLAAGPYALAVRLRNRYYDDPQHQRRVGVPVISVGNLTLGGTGKTPFVAWLARRLVQQGLPVALVSRGYGAAPNSTNDEARELALSLPGVPHIQNPDRVAAAETAIRSHAAQRIIMDDGFQHRRLARDLDVVLIDATEPFGFDRVFPGGTLREPLAGIKRADVIVLSRADLVEAGARTEIRRRLERLAPSAIWVEAIHQPLRLRSFSGLEQPLSALAGRHVAAFCAIGNPPAFAETLKRLNCELIGLRSFDDHHAYSRVELAALTDWANAQQATLICTMKDLVKIEPAWLADQPLQALEIGLSITTGESELGERVDRLG